MTLVLHMWDSGFFWRARGLGFRVPGLGFRAKGLGFCKFWGGCKRAEVVGGTHSASMLRGRTHPGISLSIFDSCTAPYNPVTSYT